MTYILIKNQGGGLRVFSLVRGLRGKKFENHWVNAFAESVLG
jgi:hypothetical protein